MAIKRLKKTKACVSCSEIANKIDTALSKSKIRRQLVTLGYKYVPNISSIILSDPQKKLRVEIVRSYITQRIDFHKVVFTDESRFSLDGNDNFKTWALKSRPVIHRRPYKGGFIMVWGAITYTDQLLLSRNSEKYCRLLTNDISFIKGNNGIVHISTG